MRKALLALVIVSFASIGSFAAAGSIPDGVDCSMTGLGGKLVTVRLLQAGPGNADRFAVCVTDGVSANGSELYLGGELRPEHATTTGFCGAFIVGGRVLMGNANWDRVDPGANLGNTADDVHITCD